MKKRLFLLPLLGGLVLSGCTFTIFGKTITLFEKDQEADGSKKDSSGGDKDTGGDDDEGGSTSSDKFEFVVAEMETPYFGDDPGSIQEFEYEGMTFYDRQAYYASSKGALWFYNQWEGNYTKSGNDKKTNENTVFSFISNKTPFEKDIKKVVLSTNTGTGGPAVTVTVGSSPMSDATLTGTKKVAQGGKAIDLTYEFNGSGKYFCITASNDVGYNLKNLMLDSIVVYF